MKKLNVIASGLALLLSLGSSLAEDKKVSLRADEWFPYNGVPGSNLQGFMIDIATEAFKEKGYTVEYETMPWTRAVAEGRKGKIDGIVGALKGDAPDFIYPELEQGISSSSFWVKNDNPWRFAGVDSLKNICLGVIKDYSYGQEMDAYIKLHLEEPNLIQSVFGEDALNQNIRKTIKGRINTFVEDVMVCQAELKNSKFTGQLISAGIISTDKIFVAFSPNKEISKIYAKIVGDAMISFRESGKLQQILSKYGIEDWAKAK